MEQTGSCHRGEGRGHWMTEGEGMSQRTCMHGKNIHAYTHVCKEHTCMAHGHRQQGGDGLRERGRGLGGQGQGRWGMGTSVIV